MHAAAQLARRCRECRPAYRAALQEFLRGLDLDEDTRRRVEINPLRVLDDKRPEVRAQLADAPLMADHLCDDVQGPPRRRCASCWPTSAIAVDRRPRARPRPRLLHADDVRVRPRRLLGAQSGIGGGGRYDGLSEDIGGPPLPGIGFGARPGPHGARDGGRGASPPPAGRRRCEVFGVPLGDGRRAPSCSTLVAELRRAGVAADMAYGGKGLKGAMKAADRSGAPYAVVLGERDIAAGVAQVKDLATGEQAAVPLAELVDDV